LDGSAAELEREFFLQSPTFYRPAAEEKFQGNGVSSKIAGVAPLLISLVTLPHAMDEGLSVDGALRPIARP
jgi:hypothetical protein